MLEVGNLVGNVVTSNLSSVSFSRVKNGYNQVETHTSKTGWATDRKHFLLINVIGSHNPVVHEWLSSLVATYRLPQKIFTLQRGVSHMS